MNGGVKLELLGSLRGLEGDNDASDDLIAGS